MLGCVCRSHSIAVPCLALCYPFERELSDASHLFGGKRVFCELALQTLIEPLAAVVRVRRTITLRTLNIVVFAFAAPG